MTIKVINNNIVVLFDAVIYSLVSLDTLKTIAVSTFTENIPNPVIAQFPEMTALTIPEVRISVLFQKSSLIVGDQTIGTFQARNNLGLVTLAKKLQESIARPVLSYGYNFVLDIENGNFETLAQTVQNKYFKRSTTLPVPTQATFKYALPNIVFDYNNSKITIKFSEVIDNPLNTESNMLRVNINVHFSSPADATLPTITDLKTNYETLYDYIHQYISSLFT